MRSGAQTPREILQSATIVAARLMRQESHIGQIVPGAFADLLIVDGDPLRDITLLADPERAILALWQGGRVVSDRLPS